MRPFPSPLAALSGRCSSKIVPGELNIIHTYLYVRYIHTCIVLIVHLHIKNLLVSFCSFLPFLSYWLFIFFFCKALHCSLRSASLIFVNLLFLLDIIFETKTPFFAGQTPNFVTNHFVHTATTFSPPSPSLSNPSFESQSDPLFQIIIKILPNQIKSRNPTMRASSILSIWAIWVIAFVLAQTPQSLPPPACHTNRCLRAFERRTQQPEASSYCSRFLNTVIEPVVVTEVAKTTNTFTFANATITQAEATTTVTE